MNPEIKLPDLSPMDIILNGLRPDDDWHEKKQLDERDEVWNGKVMKIIRRVERPLK